MDNEIEIIYTPDKGVKLIVHINETEKFEVPLNHSITLDSNQDILTIKSRFTLDDIVSATKKYQSELINRLLFGDLDL